MPHPKDTRKRGGKLWHLEDKNLKHVEAKSLKKHLVKTEDKRASINKAKDGYQVWWSKR